MTEQQREGLKRILHLYFEDLPEWKYELMVRHCEQVDALETVCVPEDVLKGSGQALSQSSQ